MAGKMVPKFCVATILLLMVFHIGSASGCSASLADDPDKIVIPNDRSTNQMILNHNSHYQDWRSLIWTEETFKLNSTVEVHSRFIPPGGAELAVADRQYVEKCKFVVVSEIFHPETHIYQPSNVSSRSKELFCFVMLVDEELPYYYRSRNNGALWEGIWRFIPVKNLPFDINVFEGNRRISKILIHKLFPQAQYSIWIDGNIRLTTDPLLILERYLWREKRTFAISVYGIQDSTVLAFEQGAYLPVKTNITVAVPEGAMIIREHTMLNNFFSCLWFNEVNQFSPVGSEPGFGDVVYRVGESFKFFFLHNCEYNSLFEKVPRDIFFRTRGTEDI